MGSISANIPLTPLDHAPPGNYSCSLSYLPLRPGVDPSQAFDVLHEALHRTFVQLPWVSGRVWPQSPSAPDWRPSQREIRHGAVDIDGPRPYQLKFHQLESPMSYDELKELAFPTDVFEDSELIWAPFMPDINTGPEVFVAQANFIPGGCILTSGMYHSAGDGAAAVAVLKLWADHCCALQMDGGSSSPVVPPGPESSDRGVLQRIWENEGQGRDTVDSIDPEAWRLLGLDPPGVGESAESDAKETNDCENGGGGKEAQQAQPARVARSAIFYVPPEKFIALQKESLATFADSAEGGGHSGISGSDAICALIWRCTLRARAMAGGVQRKSDSPKGNICNPDAVARLDMTVDGRFDFSRALPTPYLGNLTVINQVFMPVIRLIAHETPLGVVARTIRDRANKIHTASLLDAYALARRVPDFQQLSLRNSSLDSTAMLMAPLLMYPTGSLSYGSRLFGNGGRPEALRTPMGAFNRFTRISFVLPKTEHGGVEFVLNLFEEEMDLLLEDEEFGRFAMLLA